MGYRNDATSGVAQGDASATIYVVTSGVHYNDKCCWDYGNAERVPVDAGPGTMEALYFGSAKGGLNHGGAGPGPWIMADLEKGLWGMNVTASTEPTISHTFVTAMLKGDSGPSPGHFALKGGNAQQGSLRCVALLLLVPPFSLASPTPPPNFSFPPTPPSLWRQRVLGRAAPPGLRSHEETGFHRAGGGRGQL
jgi:hypothetical protein